MRKHFRHIGLYMVYLGAGALLLGFALGWTNSNAVLFSSLALVLVGAALHVYILKKESGY